MLRAQVNVNSETINLLPLICDNILPVLIGGTAPPPPPMGGRAPPPDPIPLVTDKHLRATTHQLDN